MFGHLSDHRRPMEEDDYKIQAKHICRTLLGSSLSPWKRATSDTIRCNRIKTGRSNRLYVCELTTPNEFNINNNSITNVNSKHKEIGSSIYPSRYHHHHQGHFNRPINKVIVRFYGSELTGQGNRYKSVTDETEYQILQHLSSKGMAPRVYATFQGGRIDEYLESSLGSIQTLRSLPFLHILAQKIATFHSLQLNIPNRYNHYELWRSMENQSNESRSLIHSIDVTLFDYQQASLLTAIKCFYSTEQSGQIIGKMNSLPQRVVFAHMDLNPSNFLLLPTTTSPSPINLTTDDQSSMDIMLIDIENCQFGCRGMDLGKFFVELSLTEDNMIADYIAQLSSSSSLLSTTSSTSAPTTTAPSSSPSPSTLNNLKPISDSRIVTFSQSYLSQWSIISDDYSPTLDCIDNIFTEIKFGAMFSLIAHINWNVLHPNFTSIKLLKDTVNRIGLYQHFKSRWFDNSFRPRLSSL